VNGAVHRVSWERAEEICRVRVVYHLHGTDCIIDNTDDVVNLSGVCEVLAGHEKLLKCGILSRVVSVLVEYDEAFMDRVLGAGVVLVPLSGNQLIEGVG